MARVLLGITGSVAAVKTPELEVALRHAGYEVRIIATESALYFFDTADLHDPLIRDKDEWPGTRYQRGDAVQHIELRKWADAFVIAPLDANTLAKMANGLCDNALTCVWRAWDFAKPIIVAPAMNTFMWQHPLTRQHLRTLGMLFGARTCLVISTIPFWFGRSTNGPNSFPSSSR
ncbi:MAG: flavoprotein [Gemmataceae bacterium]